ncbi:Phosphoinositide phosphatase sac1 [Vanrija albida]|uniref:Phosphoinositide phosphatase sac1 n=1 Tax=Vanrija albida TaxID=181172 RepID=A0ABR3QCL9_9TREE
MAAQTYNTLPLHESFNLYVSPSSYVFEPSSSSAPAVGAERIVNEKDVRESLNIDRKTGALSLSVSSAIPYGKEKVISCYGILGVISLATTDFLVIVTGRKPSSRLLSQAIYLATDFRLLPLNPTSSSQAILGHPVEKELVQLVERGLKNGNLWFSYGWDLTNTLQRQKELEDAGQGASTTPLWKRADERFFWNRFLQDKLIDLTESGVADLSRFILPVIFGSVELRSSTINNRDFLFALIMRRSRHRAGTRYFSRGIDAQGDVSNFNETEQIVLLDPLPENGVAGANRGRVDGRERLSFVQIRGSVPLYWAEVNNLRYKPDLQIMEKPETVASMKSHLYKMVDKYQSLYLVNLINQKGYEQPVKEAFERYITQATADHTLADRARYLYFDFHHECRKNRFDRIQVLIDKLAEPLNRMGYFYGQAAAGSGFNSSPATPNKVISKQSGVIRTNCMDCLDRTNVAQAALGKWALNEQLRKVGVLSPKESVEDHSDFMVIFRNIWADHADFVSKAYAGTGALKTDFTRTGKRSKQGLLNDGVNSVSRYVRNNFFDGDRQDAYDLVTGAYVAQRGGIPPLTDTRPLLIRSMPYVLVFALTMILAALTLPRQSEWSIYSFLFLWFILAFISGSFIWGNGISYVSWPRLNPPFEILSYEGQGFKTAKRGRGLSISSVVPGVGKRKTGRRNDEYDLGAKKKGALID